VTVHGKSLWSRAGSTEEFTRLMTRAPSWAPTLPIAAKAWDRKPQLKEKSSHHPADTSRKSEGSNRNPHVTRFRL
jgi:hypothetical protein